MFILGISPLILILHFTFLRYVKRKRAALDVIQKTLRNYRAMVRARAEFTHKRQSIVNVQRVARGYLARRRHKQLEEDAAYREQLRQEYLRQMEVRRNEASVVIVRAIRTYIVKRRIVKRVKATVVIQKFWRGYKVLSNYHNTYISSADNC